MTDDDFYEVFRAVEECYRAAYERGLDRLAQTISGTGGREQTWLERVRTGAVALLGFFDDEPGWARLLVLETPLDPAVTFACRRRLHDLLGALLDRDPDCPSETSMLVPALTGELVVGGVLAVIRSSVLEADRGPLVELAPSVMSFIVAQYLGRGAARAELAGVPAPGDRRLRPPAAPVRLTPRTRAVLRAIGATPGSSNRGVAAAAGGLDEGQASRLLRRLERAGLIENVGLGPARGEPNAWVLTADGRRLAQPSSAHASRDARGSLGADPIPLLSVPGTPADPGRGSEQVVAGAAPLGPRAAQRTASAGQRSSSGVRS